MARKPQKGKKKRPIERQKRLVGMRRETAYLALHPNVKADVQAIARHEHKSASLVIAESIMLRWKLTED